MSPSQYYFNRNFRYERYSYLLKKLWSSGLSEPDFYQKYKSEFRELISYRQQIKDQIYFNSIHEYKRLLTGYLSQKITTDEFRVSFNRIYLGEFRVGANFLNDLEKLSNFPIDWHSKGFSDFLAQIHHQLSRTTSPENPFFVEEEEFRKIIKQIFLEMEYKFSDLKKDEFAKPGIVTQFYQDEKIFGLKISLVILFFKKLEIDLETKVLVETMTLLTIISSLSYSFLKPGVFDLLSKF